MKVTRDNGRKDESGGLRENWNAACFRKCEAMIFGAGDRDRTGDIQLGQTALN